MASRFVSCSCGCGSNLLVHDMNHMDCDREEDIVITTRDDSHEIRVVLDAAGMAAIIAFLADQLAALYLKETHGS